MRLVPPQKKPQLRQKQNQQLLLQLHAEEGVFNMIKLELSIEEVNGILMALGKAPYEMAQPLVDKIKQQAVPQVQPQAAPVDAVAE